MRMKGKDKNKCVLACLTISKNTEKMKDLLTFIT